MRKISVLMASACVALMASEASAQDDTIRIGFVAPLTGPQAYFGNTWVNGVKLYAEELNAKGGIDGKMVEIVAEDDKADPREGSIIAQRFCDDESISAVIGHMNSGITIPTMDIYSDCDLVQLTVSSSPQVTELDYANIVQPVANDFAQGRLSANFAAKDLGGKTAITVNDKQAFGQGVAELFSSEFESLGGTVASEISIDSRDVDFSSVITSIKQANPDVIYFGGVMPQVALFVKQLREQGVEAKYLVPDGAYTPDYAALAGEAGYGSFTTFQAPPYDATPELVAFASAYKSKFNSEPGPQSAFGWMQMELLEAAFRANPELDRAEIVKTTRATDMETVTGRITLNENGGIDAGGLYIYEVIKDGFRLAGDDKN